MGPQHCGPWYYDSYLDVPFESVQVNVDQNGCNIPGDAANEPSIAVDPTNPDRIVIGWRQFDSVLSDFRQAGYAYSHDAGRTWTFPGSLTPGVLGTDPVLAADANGNFYYLSINFDEMRLFKSADGGVSWEQTAALPGVRDKPWMAIDKTDGPGRGNIYVAWNGGFIRSIDGGRSFSDGSGILRCGTIDVDRRGNVLIAGEDLCRSVDAHDPATNPTISFCSDVGMPQWCGSFFPPLNPQGLRGQTWVVADPAGPSTYALTADAKFTVSSDAGVTWSSPTCLRPGECPSAFSTLAIAANGRLDATVGIGTIFYTYSLDGGRTWKDIAQVSPYSSPTIGWPQQQKIGDYYHLISDNDSAMLAYAATFNGEQDIYFLRLFPDCNRNRLRDRDDIAEGRSADCSSNGIPDECEPDCNANGMKDSCDLSNGVDTDCNQNRIPDECDSILDETDCNANCVVDWDDADYTSPIAEVFDLGQDFYPSGIVRAEAPYPPGYLIAVPRRGEVWRVSPTLTTKSRLATGFETYSLQDVCLAGAGFAGPERSLFVLDEAGSFEGSRLVRVSPDGEIHPFAALPGCLPRSAIYLPHAAISYGNQIIVACEPEDSSEPTLLAVSTDGLVSPIAFPLLPGSYFSALAQVPPDSGGPTRLVIADAPLPRPSLYVLDLDTRHISPLTRLPHSSRGGVEDIIIAPEVWDPGMGILHSRYSVLASTFSGNLHLVNADGKFIANTFGPGWSLVLQGDAILATSRRQQTATILRIGLEDLSFDVCRGGSEYYSGLDICPIAIDGVPDCNDNARPDECDIGDNGDEIGSDCNKNNVPDECEPDLGPDCNLNGVPDWCEVDRDPSLDCNRNGSLDWCEVLAGARTCDDSWLDARCDLDCDGTSNPCDADIDGDGVKNTEDACLAAPVGFLPYSQGGPFGDSDGDCLIDSTDILHFIRDHLRGPDVPLVPGGATFDGDRDHDTDLGDFQQLQIGFAPARSGVVWPCPPG